MSDSKLLGNNINKEKPFAKPCPAPVKYTEDARIQALPTVIFPFSLQSIELAQENMQM